jgi:spore coat polysaccharide biosynthesis predicted glycosyltransferase SpsG
VEARDKVEKILVTQGASDPYGTTSLVIGSLERLDGVYSVSVLIGGLLTPFHREELNGTLASARRHRYELYENVSQEEVFGLMQDADIAITAAGNTLYELAYFGIPSVMIAPRSEFLQITRAFQEKTDNIDLGLRSGINESLLTSKTRSLIEEGDLRKRISRALRGLVDGEGARRICERVIENIVPGQTSKVRCRSCNGSVEKR